MQPIQVRLTKKQVEYLNEQVKKGYFPTCSEVIRHALAREMRKYA